MALRADGLASVGKTTVVNVRRKYVLGTAGNFTFTISQALLAAICDIAGMVSYRSTLYKDYKVR